MKLKQRNKIIKLIDTLQSGVDAHDLLSEIYAETVLRGTLELSTELEMKLDRYFQNDRV